MCGIFGYIENPTEKVNSDEIKKRTNSLFQLSETRGKEASGIILYQDGQIYSYKEPIRASKLIQKSKYNNVFDKINSQSDSPIALVGHSRLATNGFQTVNKNNQPIITDKSLGVHNGIIVNDDVIWKKLKKKPKTQVDTEAFLELLNHYITTHSLTKAIQMTYKAIEGSASMAMLFEDNSILTLSTNTGSLYIANFNQYEIIVFASEHYILKKWIENELPPNIGKTGGITHLKAGSGWHIHLDDLTIEPFSLSERKQKQKKIVKRNNTITDLSDNSKMAEKSVIDLYSKKNSIKKLQKHDFDYEAIYSLPRCTRCILPSTTPFISFDDKGVCNFCHEHQKITYKGKEALEKIISPYRSKNGEPDCIIAFSGGRDSSYGLHYLKNELNLNPIAYTYDWGMVKDIARRNEARMVGALGIEHIIVSADITMKRNHINKHIRAWMKKPELGMVPLFMEGDKQCEYYVDQLAKRNNIKLVFFCRGNEFEKEEFKTGHCGVKDADPGGVIHHLALTGKVKLALYYASQYIQNPAYFNSSFFDTALAFFSTYIQKHDYIFLWHYIPWNEKHIVSTLTKKYGWEKDPETNQTWRTDDGTSAFYNYIYYMGQGFTENDSFRARQIREGRLTRKKALSLVHEENKPRYKSLKWYFDRVNLDGDEVLTVVDNMPRLY